MEDVNFGIKAVLMCIMSHIWHQYWILIENVIFVKSGLLLDQEQDSTDTFLKDLVSPLPEYLN